MKKILTLILIAASAHATVWGQKQIDKIVNNLTTVGEPVTFTSTVKRDPKTHAVKSVLKEIEIAWTPLLKELTEAFNNEAQNATKSKLTTEKGKRIHLLFFTMKDKKSVYQLQTDTQTNKGKATIIIKYEH